MDINCSDGPIQIGTENVAQAINIGTAGARTITMGNNTANINLNAGVAGLTELDVYNLNINGNTLKSTDTNGHIRIETTGTGDIFLDGGAVYVRRHSSAPGAVVIFGEK